MKMKFPEDMADLSINGVRIAPDKDGMADIPDQFAAEAAAHGLIDPRKEKAAAPAAASKPTK